MNKIYLDNASTTKPCKEVVECMVESMENFMLMQILYII